jgi:hypothetical protein
VVINTFVCPTDVIPENPFPQTPNFNPAGELYGVTSYGGIGGLQSYRVAKATNDGVFFRNSGVGFADIVDGTSNTLLFGERYHRDANYDANSGTYQKMNGWGMWSPTTGDGGLGDVVLGTLVGINYKHPAGVAVDNTYEDRRVSSLGSGHSAGANVSLADGSTRFVSQVVSLAILNAVGTRTGSEVAQLEN